MASQAKGDSMLIVISVSKVKGEKRYVARSHQCATTAERPTRMEAVEALQKQIQPRKVE
jgi:hypothetical protein